MIEILIVISIVGVFGLFNEAIGTPFEKYDPKAICAWYTDFVCNIINGRNEATPTQLNPTPSDDKSTQRTIEQMNMLYRFEEASKHIGSWKWLICGYCLSTRAALILIPFWTYIYGPTGLLYTGLHLFLNITLKAKPKNL